MQFDGSSALDKMAEELGRVAVLKAAEVLRQAAIEGIGDHGHDHIEVDFGQDGRRECIEMEKLDRLGDAIFYPPASGIVADDQFHWGVEVVGDKKSRLFPTIAAKDDLAQRSFVAMELNGGFVDQRLRVFSFVMGNGDAPPGCKGLHLLDQLVSSPTERDERDVAAVEDGEILVGRELGIKDECRGDAAGDTLPEVQEFQNLAVRLRPLDICRGVEQELALRILGQEYEGTFHALASGPGPMFLQHGLIAVVRRGMEVQVDDGAVTQAQAFDLGDKGLLKTKDVCVVERVGVGGQSGTLRQGIESGEKSDAGVEGVIPHMGVAFGSQQLEGKKGEEIVQCRNMLVGGQPGLSYYLVQLQLGYEGGKEENARSGGIRLEVHGTSEIQGLCSLGHCGSLDGGTDL